MTPLQKQAWFNLAVIALCVLTVAAMVPMLGLRKAQGGMGWLGLLAFGVVFVRKRPGRVVADERDEQIRDRSLTVAYAVFWVVFVLSCVFLVPAVYGEHGAVPVEVVQGSVGVGFLLVITIESIATLLRYGRGKADALEA
jgi:hypothetical protein